MEGFGPSWALMKGKVRQLILTFSVCLGVMSCGIAVPWMNVAEGILQAKFELTTTETVLVATTPNVGTVAAFILLLVLPDRIGRIWTICLGNAIEAASWAFLYKSPTYTMVLVGRFLEGIAAGLIFGVVPPYISEISEPKIRGSLQTVFPTLYSLGIALGSIFGPHVLLEGLAIMGGIGPLISFLTSLLSPETPYYLLDKGKDEKAEKLLSQLRGDIPVKEELAEIKDGVMRQKEENKSLLKIFSIRTNRHGLVIVTLLYFFMELSGNDVFILYAQIIFHRANVAVDPSITGLIYGIFRLLSCFISLLLVDYIGRKALLLLSGSMSCLMMLLMATFFYLDTIVDTKPYAGVGLAFLSLYMICYSIGLGTVPYVLFAELFPIGVKFFALGFSQICFAVFCFFSVVLFNLAVDYGQQVHAPLWIFALAAGSSAIFTYYNIKETTGKSLETIQQDMKKDVQSQK